MNRMGEYPLSEVFRINFFYGVAEGGGDSHFFRTFPHFFLPPFQPYHFNLKQRDPYVRGEDICFPTRFYFYFFLSFFDKLLE